MHSLDLPAHTPVRLTATARPGAGLHRWDVQLLAAEGSARVAYGSRIGARDTDQRIDIPGQAVNCRLEVRSRHATRDGWADDCARTGDNTPNRLQVGFFDAAQPGARQDDILLCFAFGARETDTAKAVGRGQGCIG